MREPIAAGTHYLRDRDLLRNSVMGAYRGQRGPGSHPGPRSNNNVLGVIAPNSPYRHCSQCMAWAYKAIAEAQMADVYFIISANHHSSESGMSLESFSMPFGFVQIDEDIVKDIAAKGNIGIDEEIHMRDHGIEVQLPFLYCALANQVENLKIVPILLSAKADLDRIVEDIKQVLSEHKKKAIFIVSTVFTQHGPLFHYVPFDTNVMENVYQLDRIAFEKITSQDVEGFSNTVKEQLMNFDGVHAIEFLLKILPKCEVTVESHFTSGDILCDYKNSVSYAAIVFKQEFDENQVQVTNS